MASAPLRIAHRGVPGRAHENTLPSFSAALEAGANGIELDVHATADGVVVVHHDEALPNGAQIASEPWSALSNLELSPGVRMPTLEAVCALVGTRAELFVEIKGNGIERLVLQALRRYDGIAAIHSFDHPLIGRLADRGVAYRLGLLVERETAEPVALMQRYGAFDLWPHHTVVTPRLVEDVHRATGRVLVWTVNDSATARRLTELGVDGICTDDVATLGPGSHAAR